MGDIKYNNSDLGIQYKKLLKPQISTGFPFSVEPYQTDYEGNLTKYPLPLINATDINWGGANVNNREINTTDELLDSINKIIGIYNDSGISDIDLSDASLILVMLNAIRSLQSEVVKLRNSFKYGVTSYKDTKTVMSNVLHEYNSTEAQEPLWATDESELSIVETLNYDDPRQQKYILGNSESSILNGENNLNYVQINGNVYWEDTENILNDVSDAKLYLYLTVDHLTFDIDFITVNYKSDGKINTEDSNVVNIDFSNLDIRESINGKYNILIVIGRKQLYKENLYGENFIWISIADYLTSNTIISGYINLDNIQNVSQSPIYLNDRYQFSKINFNDLILSKFDFYSKYNDFTNNVQESTADDKDYKYEAAHITIRSVKNYEMLTNIKDQLLDDELIYCRENNKLYIISDNVIKNISTGSSSQDPTEDNIMTNEELLEKLKELGIINDNDEIVLNDIESIRFINSETGNKFDISVDAYGNVISKKYDGTKSLEFNINKATEKNINELLKCTNRVFYNAETGESTTNGFVDVRGFVSRYNDLKKGGSLSSIQNASDHKLGKTFGINADRIKIAAVYAPLSTDNKISCTHAYVELENTSNQDFPLDGCYLHFYRPIVNSNYEVEYKISHLALKGYIPANSTYLIRGKKYRDNDDSNVFIKVNTYDQEWYDKEIDNQLIDFTLLQKDSGKQDYSYSFAFTYQYEDLTGDSVLWTSNEGTLAISGHNAPLGLAKSDFPYLYVWNFIDAISINVVNKNWHSNAGAVFVMKSNSLYKNMFELDPAKQAYNSLNKKDSSRSRYQKSETDAQTVELSAGYITFPHSLEYKKLVSDYTPKASFEGKNVQTDKTKLFKDKPNAVTVSFGTNVFKTRCFNWISCGLYDEYVFLYDKDGNFKGKFESYKKVNNDDLYTNYQTISASNDTQYPIRKEFPQNVNNIVYTSLTKERIYDYFPADGTYYTSHKCIIDICNIAPSNPEIWSYKIARLDQSGNIDPNYCSEEMHFTMYPSSYIPRIYQTTDQQGFHWQEYQAWAAAAKKINEVINNECNGNGIIPILINTGDMTQSGARVSEWLDYYNAGQCLFNHLEQMNIVGNNDLSPCNVNEIGTGDDPDKSNAYFYNIFYCYEVNPIYLDSDSSHNNPIYPIINNVYIPSLYYIDINNLRLLFLNSEITEETCKTWYKAVHSNGAICNVYTGYPTTQANMSETASPYLAEDLNITTIYTMVYHMTEDSSKKYIAICHEMPFTVITRDSLFYNQAGKTLIGGYRSISPTNTLVGCHMNQITKGDFGYGIYWFSRLMEYRNIKLVLGGHKHTYCVTYPLAENYKYDTNKWSLIDGHMPMEETLNNNLERTVQWNWDGDQFGSTSDNLVTISNVNHSKLPLTLVTDNEVTNRYNGNSNDRFFIISSSTSNGESIFLPCHIINQNWINTHNNISPVIYFMCQATGYKLTSNKELPSALQRFSQLLPATTIDAGSDTANGNQQSPMYSTIVFNSSNISSCSIKLTRIRNISKDDGNATPPAWKFNQQLYTKNAMYFEYVTLNPSLLETSGTGSDKYNYGTWSSTENYLLNNINL